MKRSVVIFGLCAGVLVPALFAQTPAAEVATTAAVCLPSATLDELTAALDDAVSGPADKDRTCMRELILPEARMTPMVKPPEGTPTPHILTLDGWIEAVRKRGHATLSEHQIKVKEEVYGSIAHLWSTYELHVTPDAKTVIRGINSIQAVYDGKRWRVYGILWQAETPAEPIPEKYLP